MTHTDILRLAIDAGLAQAESMNTGRRVENHMLELAKKGQLLGGDMFGYRLKKQLMIWEILCRIRILWFKNQ